jgi:phosphoribosylaminoimidazole-succinocarboxamide synthase
MFESSIRSLPLVGRGKVRDIYAVGSDKLLIVTTDRLSAFDVVLPTPIPDKGRVLEMANFWFAKFASLVPNQLTGISRDGGEARRAGARPLDREEARPCRWRRSCAASY